MVGVVSHKETQIGLEQKTTKHPGLYLCVFFLSRLNGWGQCYNNGIPFPCHNEFYNTGANNNNKLSPPREHPLPPALGARRPVTALRQSPAAGRTL